MQISQIDQQATLRCIEGQPPLGWLGDCNTQDRVEHWYKQKAQYCYLYTFLKAYFSGDRSLLEQIPNDRKKFTEIWADDYLALYNVLYKGWEIITASWAKDGISGKLSTVKDLFLDILLLESAGSFCLVFPEFDPYNGNSYRSFCPRSAYNKRNWLRKMERTIRENPRSSLSSRKLKEFEREALKHIQEEWGFAMRTYCIMRVWDSKPRKGSSLRDVLVDYQKKHAHLWDHLYAQAHPRKGAKGYAVINGEIRNIS